MLSIFRAIIDRIKALFVTSAAQELEAEFIARHAERQAGLLRLADRYAAEGLHGVAADLRKQAEAVSVERPLAGVLPALTHLGAGPGGESLPAPATPALPEPKPAPADATPARLTENHAAPARIAGNHTGRKGGR